jgi:hypothetical protein
MTSLQQVAKSHDLSRFVNYSWASTNIQQACVYNLNGYKELTDNPAYVRALVLERTL